MAEDRSRPHREDKKTLDGAGSKVSALTPDSTPVLTSQDTPQARSMAPLAPSRIPGMSGVPPWLLVPSRGRLVPVFRQPIVFSQPVIPEECQHDGRGTWGGSDGLWCDWCDATCCTECCDEPCCQRDGEEFCPCCGAGPGDCICPSECDDCDLADDEDEDEDDDEDEEGW